jgi:glucosamine--fructose-6-phosphate aminotransferase (isomerizing)
MCGIVGYVGQRQALPILLEGLKRLEYRGYDSAGVAIAAHGAIQVRRSIGKLSNLGSLVVSNPLDGSVGLGHTRWATHGKPSEANAHPHSDCSGKIAVIHNGIIENYLPLKASLVENGHCFRSATDTEVVAHLIEAKLAELRDGAATPADQAPALLVKALTLSIKEIRGSYALAVIWAEAPGMIVVAKNDSPLVVGLGDHETFMASDVPAFLKHTRRVVYLDDGEVAMLGGTSRTFFDRQGQQIQKIAALIDWDSSVAEKGGYRHFMLKEIHEQPVAVENTLRGRLPSQDGETLERETGLTTAFLKTVAQVHIVACGTSWHAGIVGKYLLERYARLPAQVETASEFRYRRPMLPPDSLVIAISQSGETADTLAAIRLAKQSGAKVLAICNTVGSAISRSSDFTFQTRCGPECGVASTKAFVGQLTALDLFTLQFARARGAMAEPEALEWETQLSLLPALIRQALQLDAQVQEVARAFVKVRNFLYIGRGVNFPTAAEGALKLKEISYIHAEGYPAGEMKHGPLALVDSEMPVLAIATQSEVFEKTLSNIEEARARGARLIALCTQGERRLRDKAEYVLELPPVAEFASPIVNIVPLQLLAYHIADLRGCDVDQPRNLAKSVTVE